MKFYIDGPPNLPINEKRSLANKKTVTGQKLFFYSVADLESYGVLADGASQIQ